MATILWRKQDGTHAVTALAPGVDAAAEAARLASSIARDWALVGYDLPSPDPAPAPRLAWPEFRDLFPPRRRATLLAAVVASPVLLEFALDAAAQGVDMGSPRTAAGLDALVAARLITADERALLLAGLPIPEAP